MAIARTPKAAVPQAAPVTPDEKKIEALINKGGSSILAKEPEGVEEDAIKMVPVRTYESQVRELDAFLQTLPKRSRLSRNAFIVQAIGEKIQRDKAKRK